MPAAGNDSPTERVQSTVVEQTLQPLLGIGRDAVPMRVPIRFEVA